jgi:hypothetical protein
VLERLTQATSEYKIFRLGDILNAPLQRPRQTGDLIGELQAKGINSVLKTEIFC